MLCVSTAWRTIPWPARLRRTTALFPDCWCQPTSAGHCGQVRRLFSVWIDWLAILRCLFTWRQHGAGLLVRRLRIYEQTPFVQRKVAVRLCAGPGEPRIEIHVPKVEAALGVPGGETEAVRHESKTRHLAFMPFKKVAHRLAGERIGKPNASIPTARGHEIAIRAEGDLRDAACMAIHQGSNQSASLEVPQQHLPV